MSEMHSHDHTDQDGHHNGNWLFSRTGVAILVAVAVLGFLVYSGHAVHALGYWPFLLILACPLMHIFMHHDHGGHGGHHHSSANDEGTSPRNLQMQRIADTSQADNTHKKPQQDNQSQNKHGGGCH